MKADLHCHSQKSDGSLPVGEIIAYAKRIGLDYIAISDHDTLAGVSEAAEKGKAIGIRVIPAAELTTRDQKRGRPVHLLCYCPRDPEGLQRFMNETLRSRVEQKRRMIELAARKYPVTQELVEKYAASSEAVYECHIMRALADLGYTNTPFGPLCEELLSPRGSCYAPSHYPDIREALGVIREAGGIAVIAHPGQFDSIELAEELAGEGLIDGLECWHPRNSPETRERIQKLAREKGLLLTGGSDFHGMYARGPHPLGFCGCGEREVGALLELAQKRARP